MFAMLSTASISTNGNGSLKALHIPVEGDIYKRIVQESGRQAILMQNKTTHTFQGLSTPRKHSMVDAILLRQRTKYFQHEDTL